MYNKKDFEAVTEIVLKEVPSVEEIILFGSYANGTARKDSDMDIIILTGKELDWRSRRDVLNHIYRDTAEKGYLIDFLIKEKGKFYRDKILPTISSTIADEGKRLWTKT